MRDIGKNIKALREWKCLTQDQLAEKLFVTRQTVSNYETGRSRPDIEMLTKIADVLDVDANTVIYGIEPSPEQRLERKSLVIAFVFTIVLGLIWFLLAPVAQAYKTRSYNLAPQILLHIFVLPSFLLMLGWTLILHSDMRDFFQSDFGKDYYKKWLKEHGHSKPTYTQYNYDDDDDE